MGRICYIKPPECWEIKTALGVRRGTDKEVVAVIIGTVDDYCIDEMVVWMFKKHYDNCVNGQYQITSYPYSEQCLVLTDSKGNVIEPEQITAYTYIY